MNNFGNYGAEQNQFNLYNFTNWSYIDKLVWFGGTADQTVQLPSAPWVNAAHKNGVKVFGNVFFAPTAFGGSTATLNNFLEQDGGGDFIVIPIMVEIMEYYKFDGWFVNEETATNSATAQLMYEFLRDLTTAVEAVNKEVMWYDAMTLSGSVGWQNRLTTVNSPFVQNDQDGNAGNGFEQRVSSSIFINFSWSGSGLPLQSRGRATTIGRSEFEVFTGVDVWPGRNQAPFQSGGNGWMSSLHDSDDPITSFGLFAPNCVYNNSIYSNFNNDPNDYEDFYSAERHMFSGLDRNPSIEDASGFKGYANWIPASSTITSMPFETNFNTGHGLKKFTEGIEVSSAAWHFMSDQDVLPTWQFAFTDNSLAGEWDFDLAYDGGSSLKVAGDLAAGTPIDLTLYKTNITVTAETKVDVVYNYNLPNDAEVSLIVTFASNPSQVISLDISPSGGTGWIGQSELLAPFNGEILATLGIRFSSATAISDFALNIGNMKVHEGTPLSVDEFLAAEEQFVITYPTNNEELIYVHALGTQNQKVAVDAYTIQGKKVGSHSFSDNSNRLELSTAGWSKGIYLVVIDNGQGEIITKKVLIK